MKGLLSGIKFWELWPTLTCPLLSSSIPIPLIVSLLYPDKNLRKFNNIGIYKLLLFILRILLDREFKKIQRI